MWDEKKVKEHLDELVTKSHKIVLSWSFILRRHYAWLAIILSFSIGYFLGNDKHTASSIISKAGSFGEKTQFKLKEPTNVLKVDVEEETITSIAGLLGHVEKSRRRLKQEMREQFGMLSTYLMDVEEFFRINEVSKERLKRRLMIKVLDAQLDTLHLGKEKPTFTWVTAGDSVAAGHGNLFEQSYTAVLENTVKDAFASIGIDFVAKNRGISDFGSGPELAFCLESVYGSDIDILSWDFSLGDRGLDERILLWGNRAGVHPTKPIMMLIDDRKNKRTSDFTDFEISGMGTIFMDRRSLEHAMLHGIPDMTQPESKHLPDPVKYFLCGGYIEGNAACDDEVSNHICDVENAGVCLVNKFHTTEFCQFSRYQDSWNPGMKYHFLRGRLIGLFMLEMLNEALLSLDTLRHTVFSDKQATDYYNIFQNLQTDERNDELLFHKSMIRVGDWGTNDNKETLFEVNPSMIFRAHSICHTALLPSDIRYNGILSPNYRRMHHDAEGYDIGQSKEASVIDSGKVPLIYDPLERQKCNLLNRDFKDYFMIPPASGWFSITLPSKEEAKAYGKQATMREGLIFLCSRKCLENCPPDFNLMEWDTHLKEGNIEIEVDNERVIGAKEWEGCHFLEGSRGIKWGTRQIDNFEIKFKVNANDLELQISSLIIF